jgi:hypothetical protein
MWHRSYSLALLLFSGCGGETLANDHAGPNGTTATGGAGGQYSGSAAGSDSSTGPDADSGARSHTITWAGRPSPGDLVYRECRSTADCPTGDTCYQLSPDFGVCDHLRPEATTCTPYPWPDYADQCGCGGLTCPSGKLCARIEASWGPPIVRNVCIDLPCTDASTCPTGTVCTPPSLITDTVGKCLQVRCRSDAECRAVDPLTVCALEVRMPNQAGEPGGDMWCQ